MRRTIVCRVLVLVLLVAGTVDCAVAGDVDVLLSGVARPISLTVDSDGTLTKCLNEVRRSESSSTRLCARWCMRSYYITYNCPWCSQGPAGTCLLSPSEPAARIGTLPRAYLPHWLCIWVPTKDLRPGTESTSDGHTFHSQDLCVQMLCRCAASICIIMLPFVCPGLLPCRHACYIIVFNTHGTGSLREKRVHALDADTADKGTRGAGKRTCPS
jgi:hypothetical protein